MKEKKLTSSEQTNILFLPINLIFHALIEDYNHSDSFMIKSSVFEVHHIMKSVKIT